MTSFKRAWGLGPFLAVIMTASAFCFAQGATKAAPGQETFKAQCALCHDADGSSQSSMGRQLKASDLRSPVVQKQTDAQLKYAIVHGKGSMPPFGAQLNDASVNDVLAYVRRLGKKSKAVAHPMK